MYFFMKKVLYTFLLSCNKQEMWKRKSSVSQSIGSITLITLQSFDVNKITKYLTAALRRADLTEL